MAACFILPLTFYGIVAESDTKFSACVGGLYTVQRVLELTTTAQLSVGLFT